VIVRVALAAGGQQRADGDRHDCRVLRAIRGIDRDHLLADTNWTATKDLRRE
jgi:hypothetical protein